MKLNTRRLCVLKSNLLTAFGVAIAVSLAFWGNVASAQSIISEDGRYQLSKDGKNFERYLEHDSTLAEFVVPDGVETIMPDAFREVRKLKRIVLPASVGEIGKDAFICPDLDAIDVAEDNPIFCSINDVLFSKDGKTLIRRPMGKQTDCYYVPKGVETIGAGALQYCFFLRTVVIPNGVKTIGDNAISGGFLSTISLPASVEHIGDGAFENYTHIKSIYVAEDNPFFRSIDGVLYSKDGKTLLFYPRGKEEIRHELPETVDSFKNGSFPSIETLQSIETSPNSASFRSIDGVLFSKDGTVLVKCPSGKILGTYVVPAGVKEIANQAFMNNKTLTSVEIADGVETIGANAFLGCSSLTRILVPKSVKRIGNYAFNNPASSLTIRGYNASYAGYYAKTSGIKFEPIDPDERVESYAEFIPDEPAPTSAKDFPDDPNPQYMFANDGKTLLAYVENGRKLVVPDGVEIVDLDPFAFLITSKTQNDPNLRPCRFTLQAIVIPASVNEIRTRYLGQYDALESIDVAENNPNYCSVGGVLYSKDKKTLLCVPTRRKKGPFVVPDGVETIGAQAFSGCSSLTEIFLPKTVKSIGEGAFNWCSSLQTLRIPESVEIIGANAFFSCRALQSLNVAESNSNYRSTDGTLLSCDEKILLNVLAGTGKGAFNVPEGVVRIDQGAFSSCFWLTEVVVPEGVKEIADGAFTNCQNLKTIVLPRSLEKFGYHPLLSGSSPTIRAPKGSYAEEFAKKQKINFEPLN
ncbi:MAG: leucine-rich repeat domain-containing protein [Thermoguttaceae bacterium]|nr:leucine-rich repeat domain-containing protein [Thermoguttaceae bacterium]